MLRYSYLSRVLGSQSLAVLLSSRPFRHVFHQTVVNFSFRITVADQCMDPAQFWRLCLHKLLEHTHRPLVRIETPSSTHNRCLLLCRCTESVALPTVLKSSDFDSSISRELRRNSSRHTHRLSGTLDVTPFLHGSDFTLLTEASLTHSFHTPQAPMSVHATCLHLVRGTQALRPLSRLAHQAQLKRELHQS